MIGEWIRGETVGKNDLKSDDLTQNLFWWLKTCFGTWNSRKWKKLRALLLVQLLKVATGGHFQDSQLKFENPKRLWIKLNHVWRSGHAYRARVLLKIDPISGKFFVFWWGRKKWTKNLKKKKKKKKKRDFKITFRVVTPAPPGFSFFELWHWRHLAFGSGQTSEFQNFVSFLRPPSNFPRNSRFYCIFNDQFLAVLALECL